MVTKTEVNRNEQQFNLEGTPLSIQWTSHLVNLWQSKDERQGKYHLARSCGASCWLARRMRDWRLAKIERYYDLV